MLSCTVSSMQGVSGCGLSVCELHIHFSVSSENRQRLFLYVCVRKRRTGSSIALKAAELWVARGFQTASQVACRRRCRDAEDDSEIDRKRVRVPLHVPKPLKPHCAHGPRPGYLPQRLLGIMNMMLEVWLKVWRFDVVRPSSRRRRSISVSTCLLARQTYPGPSHPGHM